MSAPAAAPSRAVSLGIPALFVVLWSSGFIAAKAGLQAADPLTDQAILGSDAGGGGL